jgi:hypothetical protein
MRYCPESGMFLFMARKSLLSAKFLFPLAAHPFTARLSSPTLASIDEQIRGKVPWMRERGVFQEAGMPHGKKDKRQYFISSP